MIAGDVINWLYANNILKFVLVLIFADLITGLCVAFHPETPERFRLGALADFVKMALYYLVGGGALSLVAHAAFGEYATAADNLANLVWGLIIAALIGKLLNNLKEMFPGFPIPMALTDKRRVETEP